MATTDATVTDNQMTGAIHDKLAGKNLAPGRLNLIRLHAYWTGTRWTGGGPATGTPGTRPRRTEPE